MSDRTTAWNFGRVFDYLSRQPVSEDRDELASFMWEAGRDYDFYPYQLECDDALVMLGLAVEGDDGCTEYRDGADWPGA